MNRVFKLMYNLKLLPRWVIFLIDLSIITFSVVLGYLLRFNFDFNEIINAPANSKFTLGVSLYVLSGFLAIVFTNSYKGIIRYTGVQDGVRIFFMLLLNAGLITGIKLVFYYRDQTNVIPYSVILIAFLASFLFLFNYRLLVKYMFSFYKRALLKRTNVLIYGAGQTGIITKHVIESSGSSRVVGFLDDNRNKVGKVLNGSRIFSPKDSDMEDIFESLNVDELVITVKNLSPDYKNEIVDTCLRNHVKVRVVPPAQKWVKGELSAQQIKDINIDDLLEREAIKLDDINLQRQLFSKRICVTGAAGSIGSEIVAQVMQYKPEVLILVDQSESALFEVDRQLREKEPSTIIMAYVADITNRERMKHIFSEHKPDMVFHAAAYKHVPLMERNSCEAITCNILGTKILADLSVEHNVKKFVMISTDKAVNPTSVMGCSKRIAEIYVQSLNNSLEQKGLPHTAFVTTRFGNVLGSNGSVIPVFKKQIEQGGPVTVTHPEITRYFMTIPEACSLVLEAGAMGKGGEIFIFDMGKSVKIIDLARKMIQLSGYVPGKDIDIVFTGLREGEKLFEELLNQKENTLSTHHQKIMIAKVQEYSYNEINNFIELFDDLVTDRNELKMVALMKELVPEFKSNYSRYEVLDTVSAAT